ncbi:DUF4870 domain-containing protein [Trueperella pyogenes]|nr:hypothetical protein X956_02285 [Trueperella pyogenes TP8]SUO86705.1 Uncharacterized protein conserved in bacteria [Trueperella pyogenes]
MIENTSRGWGELPFTCFAWIIDNKGMTYYDQDPNSHNLVPRPAGPEDRTWAMLAHLSAIIAWVVSAGWISFVGPFLVWFLKKDNPYVRQAAAQSFNFNLGMWAMSLIGWILTITLIFAPIGIPLIVLSFILTLWHHIKATISASNNRLHHYPYQIKILS